MRKTRKRLLVSFDKILGVSCTTIVHHYNFVLQMMRFLVQTRIDTLQNILLVIESRNDDRQVHK